jgi:catechol 2,3-dioxygenase-like lactoylglutathione lyase family enzyme
MRIHISLNVSNIGKSIEFYRGMLGSEPTKTKPGYANFRLNNPPIHLALQESTKQVGEGVSHLGVELDDREMLENWHRRFESAEVNFKVEDKARCCYAKADKLWAQDPDGYSWEFWLRPGEFDDMGATRV